MKPTLYFMVILCITPLITGCQKLIGITARFDQHKLVFYIKNKTKEVILRVYGVVLYKENCESDCVFWQLNAKYNSQGFKNYEIINGNTIPYGIKTNKLDVTVPPKTLVPGKYTLTADISSDEKVGNGVIYKFEIDVAPSGDLNIVNDL